MTSYIGQRILYIIGLIIEYLVRRRVSYMITIVGGLDTEYEHF